MKYSKLPRIYLNFRKEDFDDIVISSPAQIHYIRNVLRLKLSDVIRIFNEILGEYVAKVTICDKKEIRLCVLEEEFRREAILTPKLSIAPSIIKNDRFSGLIDTSIQQGVTNIFPIISEFTNFKKLSNERIERIIVEATEQSERFDKAFLNDPIKLEEINFSEFEAIIYANEKANDSEIFDYNILKKENILLLTGPEGGFSEQELDFLSKFPNSYPISLGRRILRSETAMNCLISYTNLIRSQI